MRLGAIVLGVAALALVAGASVWALTSRAGPAAPKAPVVVTTTVPSAPGRAIPRATGSGDDQAGDRNSGASSGDDQAGDGDSGDSSGDDQAGDGKPGGA